MAKQAGISVNRLVLDELRQIAGLDATAAGAQQRHHDLDHLAGTWSEAEFEAFQVVLEQQRVIDPDLWQTQN